MITVKHFNTFPIKSKIPEISVDVTGDFLHAVSTGNAKRTEHLRHLVDPTVESNLAIRLACRYGYTEIVEQLLLDNRIDPSAKNDEAICVAAYYGYTKIVALLQSHPLANPGARNNLPLRAAILGMPQPDSHVKLVAALLQDKRVDPGAAYSAALRYAAEDGHTQTVRLLLEDGRAEPKACGSYALQAAVYHNHTEIVEALLKDNRVHVGARDQYAMCLSVLAGNESLSRLLANHQNAQSEPQPAWPEPPALVCEYFYTPEDWENVTQVCPD